VVQGDDLPLVVEHRRAGRAAVGTVVVDEVIEHIDDLIVAQGYLLGRAAGC
jgi:hypothetical protein